MKVLIAVDDSEISRKAVAFAGNMLGGRPAQDVDVTLLHVVESLPDYIMQRSTNDQVGSAFRQVADEWTETCRLAGERLLLQQAQVLTAAGLPAANVHTKLAQREGRPEARRVLAALTIIEEMRQGEFDVVVIGRRGTSASIESFIGSVAEKVAREAYGRTLWIVD